LEKGQDDDWFSSKTILWCSVAAVIGLVIFLYHELRTKQPAVDLRIMRFRSVAVGLFFQTGVGFVLFGVSYVLPSFAQIMLGYTAFQAGLLQVPSAIVTGIMFPIVGMTASKVDARIYVAVGTVFLAGSCWMLSPMTLTWGWNNFLISSLMRGFGLVLVFLPLTLAAVGDCPTEDIQTAASLLSLMRTLGGSLGIATLTTILTRRQDFHRAILVEKITPYGTQALDRLNQMKQMFEHNGWSPADAYNHALTMMSGLVNQQSALLSYADVTRLLAVFTICTLPFCLLLTSGRKKAAVEMH
jgi:DHA2 family multidrug resistance protein